jgi:hypothetical protein
MLSINIRHLQWRRASDTKLKADAPPLQSRLPEVAARRSITELSKPVGGCVSAIDSNGRTIWIADAHRDGRRFIVRADKKLTAFVELESAIRACGELA